MKLKRILAAALAGVMAITSSVVTTVTASAAETTAYINLKGNTTNWAMNIDYAGKTMINEGTNTYEISVKNENTYGDTLAALAINFFDPDSTGSLKDLKLTDVEVNGISKGVVVDTVKEEAWLWNGTGSVAEGYYISLTADDFASIGTIDVGSTVTFIISATYEAPDTSGSDVWAKNTDGTYSLTRGTAETVPSLLLNLTDYTEADYKDITAINVVVDIQNGNTYTNGGFGLNDAVSGWVQSSWNESGSTPLALNGVEAGQQLNFQIWSAAVGTVITVKGLEITVAATEPTIYHIDAKAFENAMVLVPETAVEGEEVTVTYKTIVSGYSVDSITIKDAAGKEIVPTETIGDEDGSSLSYTFEMPASDVSISAEISAIVVKAVVLRPGTATIVVGEDATLVAEVTPDNALDTSVTWSSSDTSVATVDQNGKVTAVAEGEVTITAEAANGVKATASITTTTKKVPATAVTLSKTKVELETGASETITATVTPANTTDVIIWSSSDETVATVAGGKITSLKAGTATITAKANADVFATCSVTVTDPVAEEPEEEVLLEGTYADGKWEQLSAEEIAALGELNTNTVVGDEYLTTQNVLSVQYSAAEKKFRIYQVYSAETLAGKSSASIVVKKGDVALKLTTSRVYKNLAADQTAPDGCYYIAWVISEVDDPTAFSYSGITLA